MRIHEELQMTKRFLAFVDGGVLGKNPSPRGVYWSAIVVANDGDGEVVHTCKRKTLCGDMYRTNNDAEWLAVRYVLDWVVAHHPETALTIYSDSRMIVCQFNGHWRARIARHARLMHECRRLSAQLTSCTLSWKPRRVLYHVLGH